MAEVIAHQKVLSSVYSYILSEGLWTRICHGCDIVLQRAIKKLPLFILKDHRREFVDIAKVANVHSKNKENMMGFDYFSSPVFGDRHGAL